MTSLAEHLEVVLGSVFARAGHDPALGSVGPSRRPDLADFQCNGAMSAGSAHPPQELAAQIAEMAADHHLVSMAECAGPGFINLKVSDAALAERVDQIRSDPCCGGGEAKIREKILIDFGGLNIAKPMHIGHLRSLIIGDSLQRLLRFVGHEVVSDIHLGDWGLQMGLILAYLREHFPAAGAGEVVAVTLDQLEDIYPQASARSSTDEAFLEAARLATLELQDAEPWHRAQWSHVVEVSLEALRADLEVLGVSFDLWKGESDAAASVARLIDDLEARGIAGKDSDALTISVAEDTDSKSYPPVILVNSRGASGYHATDLGTIADRMAEIAPDRIVYVVDQRQALHFEQLFRASQKAGLMAADRLEHVRFGTMNGKDGKPFRTRAGGVLRLSDLMAMARSKAAQTLATRRGLSGPDDLSAAERDQTDKIALAAIRFADLNTTRTTNYVFDLDQFMSFEGCTGPYLQYAAVRIRSVMRRAQGEETGPCAVSDPTERALALHLDRFSAALSGAAERYMPHIVCDHAYGLAQRFAAFYRACPIATAVADKRSGRLALADATLRQLTAAMGILGIQVPRKM